MKRFLSSLLVLCMAMTFLPASAAAASVSPFGDVQSTDWYYDEVQYVYENGLMSGTSADGIDAAVVELRGCGTDTRVRQLGFITLPFSDEARQKILQVAGGAPLDSREICLLNFYLGALSADACLEACRAASIQPGDVDFVGSHGQTIWHEPVGADYLGRKVRATLQIGEPSLIAERLGCPVVSDFRVRDMAAGGLGAPLVPYTEYLLYREEHRTVALQNIGGIGNITVLPAGGALADTLAFDTGPGNMVIDALAARVTNGALRYDDGGKLARQGQVSAELLRYLVDSDDYLRLAPPKTTGREHYSAAFADALWRKGEELGLTGYDKIATATAFTAESIRLAVEHHCPQKPERLIVGGGGSHNPVLMELLQAGLPGCEVVTNEALGLDSDAKEAVAFAILANEMLHGRCNNAPSATGATHPVVMGKLSL